MISSKLSHDSSALSSSFVWRWATSTSVMDNQFPASTINVVSDNGFIYGFRKDSGTCVLDICNSETCSLRGSFDKLDIEDDLN